MCCLGTICFPVRPYSQFMMFSRPSVPYPPLAFCLQSRGLNDPFTGGLSSYGLVLMVTFALLQRDHFPPSPGSNFLQRSSSGSAPAEDQADGAQPEASRPRTLPSRCQPADVKDVPVPPSPGHASSFPPSPKAKPREAPVKKIRKRAAPSVGRQRFWQPSSFVESRSGRTVSMASGARAANALNEQEKTQTSGGGRISSWDRYGYGAQVLGASTRIMACSTTLLLNEDPVHVTSFCQPQALCVL